MNIMTFIVLTAFFSCLFIEMIKKQESKSWKGLMLSAARNMVIPVGLAFYLLAYFYRTDSGVRGEMTATYFITRTLLITAVLAFPAFVGTLLGSAARTMVSKLIKTS